MPDGGAAFRFGAPTPILRSFDEGEARRFYIDYLGAEVLFEHRFGEGMPLYVGLRLGGTVLHLSEHHGDTTPGTRVRIAVEGIEAFADALAARPHPRLTPGRPERQPWGERDLTLTDPFGNRLTFHEDIA